MGDMHSLLIAAIWVWSRRIDGVFAGISTGHMIVWGHLLGLKAIRPDIRSGDSTWIYSGGRGDVLAAVVCGLIGIHFGRPLQREGENGSINVDSHLLGMIPAVWCWG